MHCLLLSEFAAMYLLAEFFSCFYIVLYNPSIYWDGKGRKKESLIEVITEWTSGHIPEDGKSTYQGSLLSWCKSLELQQVTMKTEYTDL